MKKALLLLLFLNGVCQSFAQSPIIEGDLMLCPDTEGTATVTNQTAYDSYQWYSKYWFTADEYQPIQGATEASFTYDWYTYDQSLFKVVVTLGGETLESNVIQIDSYAWSSLIIQSEMNESVSTNMDNGNFMLCPGGSFSNTVGSPYNANIQWYKDNVAIAGANQATYLISEPGNYHVEAAPDFCPNSISNNQSLPLVVVTDTECNLGTNPNKLKNNVSIAPNPVSTALQLTIGTNATINKYSIIDTTGKVIETKVVTLSNAATIDVSHLSNGLYLLVLESDSGNASQKFIKE